MLTAALRARRAAGDGCRWDRAIPCWWHAVEVATILCSPMGLVSIVVLLVLWLAYLAILIGIGLRVHARWNDEEDRGG
jgi:hypothetical protein